MEKIFLNLALGGDTWVLWILMLASVLSVAVMIERWLVFRAASRGDAAALMDALAARLEEHDVDGAWKLARESGRVEGRVAAAGLENFAKGPAAVEEVMFARWLREKMLLERWLIVLGTLGNNAPFIGLFGTVLGIIKAFNDLALTGQGGVTVVMAGISAALIATAFGILVAIPAVVANNYFLTRLKQIQTNTDSLSRILLAYLKNEDGRAQPRSKTGVTG
jgi:biopolymer transport protein ExbB